jgi:hypothetical protein
MIVDMLVTLSRLDPFQYVRDNAKTTTFGDESSYNEAMVASLLAARVEVIAVTDHYRPMDLYAHVLPTLQQAAADSLDALLGGGGRWPGARYRNLAPIRCCAFLLDVARSIATRRRASIRDPYVAMTDTPTVFDRWADDPHFAPVATMDDVDD